MTPLFEKLNLKDQSPIHVLGAPPTFAAALRELDDVAVRDRVGARETVSFAIAFVQTQAQRDAASASLTRAAIDDAVLWFAYPKGTSKRFTCEFNRDSDWAVLAAAGFERVRMVAIDADWSALRFRRVAHIRSMTRHPSRAQTPAGKRRSGAVHTTASPSTPDPSARKKRRPPAG